MDEGTATLATDDIFVAPLPPATARWSFDRVSILGALGAEILAVAFVTGMEPAALTAHPALYLLLPAAALAGLLVARPTRTLTLVAGLAVAAVPLQAFFVVTSTAGEVALDPRAPPEFVGMLLMAGAFVLAFPAALHGFSSREAGVGLIAGLRTDRGAVLLLGFALLVGASVTSLVTWDRAAAEATRGVYDVPPEATVLLRTDGLSFSPAVVQVQAGVITEIVIENRDLVFHTLSYADDEEVRIDLLPGTTTRFLVLFEAPGAIPFWCEPHSPDHASGMVGVFDVRA